MKPKELDKSDRQKFHEEVTNDAKSIMNEMVGLKPLVKPKELDWSCRFHPTDWFHEVGCPHMKWTKKQLREALETSKQNNKMSSDYIQSLLTQQRTELENQKVKVVWNDVCEQIKQEARTEILEEIKKIVEEQLFWYRGEDYGSITAREALNQVKKFT